VAAVALLANERLQRLLHLRTRGMLPMGNGKGSEDDVNKGNKESKGVKSDEGEGDKGDDGNFPEGGGRQWMTQQSTRNPNTTTKHITQHTTHTTHTNTCYAWAGGTFFPVVLLCQCFVLEGNRFRFYILLMYLEYHTTVVLC
jgi:hypothetical protein